VIKEVLETGKTSIVARRYELNANMASRWVREYKNGNFGDVDIAIVPHLDLLSYSIKGYYCGRS